MLNNASLVISKMVQDAAEDYGIKGVMELTNHCELKYPRVKKVWEGNLNAKVGDYIIVMESLGQGNLRFKKNEE